jgi:hypothetical protein
MSLPGIVCDSVSTFAVTANGDYYSPIHVATPIMVDQLQAEVTVALGTNFRIGLYAADTGWQPVGAPLADSGNLDASTTGVRTYTPSSPLLLNRGRYVTVLNADNGPTFRAVLGHPPGNLMATILGSGPYAVFLRAARTYGAFPTPGTAWATVTTGSTGHRYYVVFRVLAP